MADPIRDLWALFFVIAAAAVITTAVRLLWNEPSRLFKAIAWFAAIAAGFCGFIGAAAALFAP